MTVQILQLLTGQALDSPCKGEASALWPGRVVEFLLFIPLVSGSPMQAAMQAHAATHRAGAAWADRAPQADSEDVSHIGLL